MPTIMDRWSSRVLQSGYEKLTEDEYKQFNETSKTFKHYKDNLKLLVVVDELPEDVKTPHEAIVDAKKEIRLLTAENEELKAKLASYEKKGKGGDKPVTDDVKE
jgi:hypothetical protein